MAFDWRRADILSAIWLERLPLHHIDTSVVLEPEYTDDGKYCKKYILKLGYNYRGKLSFPVLSELFAKFLSLKDVKEEDIFRDFMAHLRDRRDVDFYSPKRIGNLMEEIYDLDSRLEPTDIQIVACAIEDKADILVTLDKNLISHKSVQEKYNLKICHPREFI